MSTDKTIKTAVEKCISLLPKNLQDKELAFQISELQCARNQIDGISWLLVVESRWSRPIGDWVGIHSRWSCGPVNDLQTTR